jgi:hypothetical protein
MAIDFFVPAEKYMSESIVTTLVLLRQFDYRANFGVVTTALDMEPEARTCNNLL